MAYPSLNPLKLTFARFENLVNNIPDTKRFLNDNWTDEDVVKWKGGRDNRRMIWQHHLPAYYLDPFSEEYHRKMFEEVADDDKPVIEVATE